MLKPLIINLRGNSGSGKTFTTRAFMERCKPLTTTGLSYTDGPFLDYRGQRWAVLGRYTNACGGCDTIKTQNEIVNRVQYWTRAGINVWLEGLIMSTIYGTVGAYSEQFKSQWVFAYLQPPIEECIRRIKARRRAAGNTKPLNEDNTRRRVSTIARNREIVLSYGRRVVDLNWEDPLPQLLKIINKEGRR